MERAMQTREIYGLIGAIFGMTGLFLLILWIGDFVPFVRFSRSGPSMGFVKSLMHTTLVCFRRRATTVSRALGPQFGHDSTPDLYPVNPPKAACGGSEASAKRRRPPRSRLRRTEGPVFRFARARLFAR
jgi:hypothetical protein